MEYAIKELAALAGVTTRTLRWYDKEGLLKPLRTTEAGYRVYGPNEVERLQQILFYRELGLALAAIRAILEDPCFDREAALQSHLTRLQAGRARLDVLILTVEKTLQSYKGDVTMSDEEKFEGLKQEALAENERRYGAEIRLKYGEKTVEESNRKLADLTQEQYEAMNRTGESILTKLEGAVRQGTDPRGEAGEEIAALHRDWLAYTWPSYSVEAHKGLVQMYVNDQRYTAYYDKRTKGCAQFLCEAVHNL